MPEKFEAVVIGAGPAGLRAAKILAEAGKKVIVLERNSSVGPKICAGGAFDKVYKEGIPEDLIERKFTSLKIHLGGRVHEIKTNQGYLLTTVDRGNLGQWMAKEAERAGAKILTDSQVVSLQKDRVILKNNKEIYFDYLIGADGGTSLVRKHLNLPLKFALCYQYTIPGRFERLEVFYEPKLFGAGYGWIFPHKNWAKVGCGSDLKFHNGNQLKENFHSWLKKERINYEGAELEGHIINYNYLGHKFGNVFLVGEAAGFVSGLSGAGIYAGIISGQEIARQIINQKYRPKITLMLASQKLQEKVLDVINLNETLTKIFIEIMTLYLVVSTAFFNFFKKERGPE